MRQVLGISLSAIAIGAAAYLIFETQIGAHIGSMLGVGLYSMAQFESSALQVIGIRTLSLASIMRGNCVIVIALTAWHVAAGTRNFDDLPYKTILNAGLGLLGASSIWILNQGS